MNKEELLKKFEQNVNYLKRNVPPDDIYMFAEQTFMVTLFFIKKWSEWVDLNEEADKDPITRKWLTNIIGMQICKDKEFDIDLDLDMDNVEKTE